MTWRAAVDVELAGRTFGAIKLDISPRAHELGATDTVVLPNALEFAGIPTVEIEIIDVHRHAAEKFHGMIKDFGERENARVRDLADLMLLLDSGLLSPGQLAASVTEVWSERDACAPPAVLPDLPQGWPPRYSAWPPTTCESCSELHRGEGGGVPLGTDPRELRQRG